MKRIADFVVEKRFIVFMTVLALTIACGVLATFVEVNTDMSKYLPDDSSMKIGLDLMDEEFPAANDYTIRVMFTDLSDQAKREIQAKLKGIPGVDQVDYKNDHPDYNKAQHTLYVLHTPHDFDTTEELAIESALKEAFVDYDMLYARDSEQAYQIELWIIMIGMLILLAILFCMCASWLEPFLFLIAIGVAVVINLGTNIFMGSISDTTFSIAAMLQMILSMDYSIILINRYRQELPLADNKYTAMKSALVHAFSSIASSCMTTVVGLLVLIFMRFKIGMDLGIVLAKGVFISMLCIFTFLPALILMCDRLIHKTAKKVLHIKMDGISTFSYRFRHAIAVGLALLFAGSYLLQDNIDIAYTLKNDDPIAKIFPLTNTVLVLFDNQDDEAITRIADHLESNKHVKEVSSFSTTVGKPYTSAELADEIKEMDSKSESDLNASVLDILYYYSYKQGETGKITTGDFLKFIAQDVATNPTFAKHISDDIKDHLDVLPVFAKKEELLSPKSIAELADILDLDQQDITNLLVYYYGKHGGAYTGTMTLPEFVGFIKSDVLTDQDFRDLLDDETLDQINTLSVVTDSTQITAPKTSQQIAEALDMKQEDVRLLFLYYYGKNGGSDKLKLSFNQFSSMIVNNMLSDQRFASAFDEDARDQMKILGAFGDEKKFKAPYSSRSFANLLNIKPEMADMLYSFYYATNGDITPTGLTMQEFTQFLQKDIAGNPSFSSMFRQEQLAQMQMLSTFTNPDILLMPCTSEQMGQFLQGMGIDQSMINLVYALYHADGSEKLTIPEFMDTLSTKVLNSPFAAMVDPAIAAQIERLHLLLQAASGGPYEAVQLATLSGLEQAVVEELLLRVPTTQMELTDFFGLMIGLSSDPYYRDLIGQQNLAQFTASYGLLAAAASGQECTAAELAAIFGMDQQTVAIVFGLSGKHNTASQTMTLSAFIDYLTERFAPFLGESAGSLSMLKVLKDAALSGQPIPYTQMAALTAMDPFMTRGLYIYHMSVYGQVKGPGVALYDMVDYITNNLASTGMGSASLSRLSAMKVMMDGVIAKHVYTANELSDLINMDITTTRILYAYYIDLYGDTSSWVLSIEEMVDYILYDMARNQDFGKSFDQDTLSDLKMLQAIMAGTLAQREYKASDLADLLKMDQEMPTQLYLLKISRYGDTSSWKLPLHTFIHFIGDDILTDETLSSKIQSDDTDMLDGAKRIVDSVIEGSALSFTEMTKMFEGTSDDLSPEQIKLLYVYYFSQIDSDPSWTFTLADLFNYLLEDILPDPLFKDVFDQETRQMLLDTKADLDEGILQLKGPNYSRMVIETTYPGESGDTYAFLAKLIDEFDQTLQGQYYMVGGSPMNYEMSQSFHKEMTFITILTAIVIFVVIAVTFRSLLIPSILVLIIQCGVYVTICFIQLQGYSIYYLALLIVQCILMGATIDYGILFTSYYIERRKTHGLQAALTAAYEGSIHTILTSGLIMILVTGFLGKLFENPTVGQICETISKGAVCATLLILFVLPGVLAVFDRWICRQPKQDNAQQSI